MTNQTDPNSICCPKFDPTQWDDKIVEWKNRKFIKESVFTFFYMPINFGKAMKRLDEKVTEAGATVQDGLCLSEHTSKWNMDLYLAVDREITSTDNATFDGKYYCKVYEGPFKDTGKWHKDFEKIAESKGFNSKKLFVWYTTCPKCAKKYGKNYVVIICPIE
jgi:hypothetical protein